MSFPRVKVPPLKKCPTVAHPQKQRGSAGIATLTLRPLLFLTKKTKGNPEKGKGFSLRGTPKILGKERKNAQKKQRKSENEKRKEIEKGKDWRVRAHLKLNFLFSCTSFFGLSSSPHRPPPRGWGAARVLEGVTPQKKEGISLKNGAQKP